MIKSIIWHDSKCHKFERCLHHLFSISIKKYFESHLLRLSLSPYMKGIVIILNQMIKSIMHFLKLLRQVMIYKRLNCSLAKIIRICFYLSVLRKQFIYISVFLEEFSFLWSIEI